MSTEENKARVRRAFEAFAVKGNLGAVEEYIAPNYVGHFPGVPAVTGREGFRQFLTTYISAFSDRAVSIEDVLADGDRVVIRLTFSGTHTGEFNGVPPTGKRVSAGAINLVRLVDGKAVEQWANNDDLGMLQQMGVMPMAAQPGD